MIVKQKIIRNVCLTAHPKGCAKNILNQIMWVKEAAAGNIPEYAAAGKGKYPKNVLIIGGSTGYGLAARIVSSYVCGADTINVSFEREPKKRKTATPGWYNTTALEKEARAAGRKARSVFGDAFSLQVKAETTALIKESYGPIDLVIYSLASPMRVDPVTGDTFWSVIKPVNDTYASKTIDPFAEKISTVHVDPATEEQIADTIKVMGGEDWQLWIETLKEQGLLADGCKTVAFSYIGPEVTYPIYREGSIGKAKEHLEQTAGKLDILLRGLHGTAYVSINKALVTRASSVIPAVPLYITILYRIMKEKGLHEGCIEQMYRMMTQRLYTGTTVPVDEAGRIRLDDRELRDDVQQQVKASWDKINQENLLQLADLEGFRKEYEQIHGFGLSQIDYTEDIDPRLID